MKLSNIFYLIPVCCDWGTCTPFQFSLQLEEEELEEFELLEQAAANASFSSNSSVVVKVLAKARGNTLDSKHVISGRGVDSTNNRGTDYGVAFLSHSFQL